MHPIVIWTWGPTPALGRWPLAHDAAPSPRYVVANVLRSNAREGDWNDRGNEATDRDKPVERGELTQLVRRLSIDKLRRIGISS